MLRVYVTLCMFLFACSLSGARAEIYTWTDEQGTVHFTEELENVPQKIRSKARIVEESEPPREEEPLPAPSVKAPDMTPQVAPSGKDGKSSPAEIYAGKTFDQWVRDFAEREVAMNAVRKRIVEITELMTSPSTKGDEQNKLLAEHTSLLAQFNKMKAEYNQQVEIARKGGLRINIQQ